MSGPLDKKTRTSFTTKQKLAEIERIIVQRKKAYPGHVAKKQMFDNVAAKRIDVLRAIARDYRILQRGSPVQPAPVDWWITK